MSNFSELIPYLGGAEAARRLFGPSLDVVGTRLAGLTESMLDNLSSVIRSAWRKRAHASGDGTIPPRALSIVWEEAPFAEDAVVQDYFGGVLASSQSSVGRDDTAVVWAKRISAMSSYSLRLHYLLYAAGREALLGNTLDFGVDQVVNGGVYLAFGQVEECMDIGPAEDFNAILSHAFTTLREDSFIGERSAYGDEKVLISATKGAPTPMPGIVFYPTRQGVSLWLVAHGYPALSELDKYLDPAATFEADPGLPREPGISTQELRQLGQQGMDELKRKARH